MHYEVIILRIREIINSFLQILMILLFEAISSFPLPRFLYLGYKCIIIHILKKFHNFSLFIFLHNLYISSELRQNCTNPHTITFSASCFPSFLCYNVHIFFVFTLFERSFCGFSAGFKGRNGKNVYGRPQPWTAINYYAETFMRTIL